MIDKTRLPVVTSSKLFINNNPDKIDPEGLLSEKIFGPRKDYKCACGAYNQKGKYKDQRCPTCGVLCTKNDVRYKTFARIRLPLPIYKMNSISKSKLLSLISTDDEKHILDPTQSDLSLTTTSFLRYTVNKKKEIIKLVKDYNPLETLPLCIKGTYSLYIGLKVLADSFHSALAREILNTCFTYDLLVTPPSTRPCVMTFHDNVPVIINSDVNKIYMQILELCNYDWGYITDPIENENNFVKLVVNSMGLDGYLEDNEIMQYDNYISKYQYYSNKLYTLILDQLSGKEGMIRKDFLGRSIDFSSRAHIIVDPSLKSYEIKIPKSTFIRLWFLEYLRYLQTHHNVNRQDLMMCVKVTEGKIINKYPQYIDDFIEYFFSDNVNILNKLVFINRQPTLFRYGIPVVLVVGITEGDVIANNPLIDEPMNADYDGDK